MAKKMPAGLAAYQFKKKGAKKDESVSKPKKGKKSKK